MKKLILLLAATAGLTNNIVAQDLDTDFREKLTLGLKTGLNFSNVYDTKGEDFNTDTKLGFAGGVFLAIPIGKFLGVQPEVLFSQKGFQASGTILGGIYNFTRTTNYIDIPLLFAFKPNGLLTILAGPQYSYLLKQKDVFTKGNTSIEQQKEFTNDNIRLNTLGFVAGLDINLKHIVIGARAGIDLQNNNGNGTSSTPRYKNALLQGTVGYRFYSND